jgi:phage terminase large subunit
MEYADYGVVTIAGQNSVVAGLQRVKGLLVDQRLAITVNCENLIDQFRKYRWQTAKRGENEGVEAPVKKDDHLLDALRYAVMSRPRVEGREVENKVPLAVRLLEEDAGRIQSKVPSGTFGPGQFV